MRKASPPETQAEAPAPETPAPETPSSEEPPPPEAPPASRPRRGRAERFRDRLAPGFDSDPKGLDPNAGRALTLARRYLKPGDTVLDFGCATGHAALRLATDVKAVYGIDTSQKMIAVAQQKAEVRKVPNVHFAHSTLFDEEYGPGSFEVVLALDILHLTEDVQRVVYRIADLLRPGGTLISVTPCLGERGRWASRFTRAGLRLLIRTGVRPYLGVYKVIGLQNTIAAAGLVTVEIEELEHGTAVHFIAARKPVVPWYK